MACRLLYVIGQMRAGGAERQMAYLLECAQQGGLNPGLVIWTPDADDPYTATLAEAGVRIYPLAGSRIAKLQRLRALVRTERPEVLHSFSLHTNAFVALASAGLPVVAVGSLRGGLVAAMGKCGKALGRLSARWPDCQVWNSQAAVDEIRLFPRWSIAQRVQVVTNGLDLDSFPHVPPPDDRVLRVIGVGTLSPIKRWDRLIRGVAARKKLGGALSLTLVGDGPLRKELVEMAAILGVANETHFIGFQKCIAPLLASAHVLVHSSSSEGYPNAIMEAMAAGRPVLGTAVGDVPKLLTDGESGFLLPAGDDEAIVTAIAERLAELDENRDRIASMGDAGRRRAEREFGLTQMFSRFLETYRGFGWRGN